LNIQVFDEGCRKKLIISWTLRETIFNLKIKDGIPLVTDTNCISSYGRNNIVMGYGLLFKNLRTTENVDINTDFKLQWRHDTNTEIP
jgi:hypothetical protein